MGQELDNDQLQSFFSGLLVRKGGADSSRS